MARLTNAELNRLLIESQQANAALRQELSVLRAELERVRKELADASKRRPTRRSRPPHVPPSTPTRRSRMCATRRCASAWRVRVNSP
jgi:uncharacterized coiled-coil protein SlyX